MKKKLLALSLIAVMSLSFTACGGGTTSSSSDTKTKTEATTAAPEATTEKSEESYQSILDNYTQKLKDATPGLVDEFNKEASEKSRDVNALAGICNSKVEKLAEICNIGVGEMADLMNKNGDDYSKYEEWAKKLQGVYATQSKEIQDAYTSIATGQ